MKKIILILLLIASLVSPVWGQTSLTGGILTGGRTVRNWIPTDLPSLELWLDALQETFANDDHVGTWTDRSGLGNHATQSTDSLRPHFKTNIKNGLPAILWDTTDDKLLTALSVTQPDTWIFVTELPVPDTTNYYLVDDQLGGATTRRLFYLNTLNDYRFGTGDTTVLIPQVVTNQWAIIELIFNGASSKAYINGDLLVVGDAGSDNIANFTIGNHNSAAVAWDGHIGEIIVADENLSDTNRYLSRKYLSQKWAINAVLSEHEVNVVNGTTENIQIPAFTKTPDGTYYLVAYAQGTTEISDDQALYVKRIAAASDKWVAANWSAPSKIYGTDVDGRWDDGCSFLVPGDGYVYLFMTSGPTNASTRADELRIYKSNDNGANWTLHKSFMSTSLSPSEDNMRAAGEQGVIKLANGNWLCGYHWVEGAGYNEYHVGVLISTDSGANWTNYGNLTHPSGVTNLFAEPTVFQKANGNLVMYIRTASGVFYQSISTDNGQTWGSPSATTIVNPSKPGHVLKHSSGNLYLIHDADATNFYPLAIKKSTDEGTTWTHWNWVSLNLLEANYPQLYEADGGIYAVYNKQDPAWTSGVKKNDIWLHFFGLN